MSPTGVNIHIVNVKCILRETFMRRGPIECEDCCAVGMCMLKDFYRDLDLIDQLGEIVIDLTNEDSSSNEEEL